jgi:hypothetical protein
MTPEASRSPNAGWHAPLPEKLPRPTPFPAVVAMGATLLALGIVTSWVVSGVGLVVFILGVDGWIRELRHARHE